MIDNAKLRIPAFRHLSVLDFAATDGKNLGTAFFVVSCYNSEWELTQVKNRGEKKDGQVYTKSRRGIGQFAAWQGIEKATGDLLPAALIEILIMILICAIEPKPHQH